MLLRVSFRSSLLICMVLAGVSVPTVRADDFEKIVQPYIRQYCLDCHNATEARGELDFTQFSSPRDVIDSFRRWSAVVEFVSSGEMPPADAPQPSAAES
ncbi:MAG: c-type cytochrome domain-containing protein, partial [Planctomycetaceae bacterium]